MINSFFFVSLKYWALPRQRLQTKLWVETVLLKNSLKFLTRTWFDTIYTTLAFHQYLSANYSELFWTITNYHELFLTILFATVFRTIFDSSPMFANVRPFRQRSRMFASFRNALWAIYSYFIKLNINIFEFSMFLFEVELWLFDLLKSSQQKW